MEYIIENWFVAVAILCLVFIASIIVKKFLQSPSNSQVKKIREWLLFAVIQAEMNLGGKTGRLKLSQVYGAFLTQFKWLSLVISFETFSGLVDLALIEMKEMLETNNAVKELVRTPQESSFKQGEVKNGSN